MEQPAKAAVVRIEIKHIRSPIWRRVAVPVTMNLKDLHDVIQTAMGWFGCHLWEFEVGDRAYGEPDLDGDGWGRRICDARSLRLSRLVESGVKTFGYTHDFGDGWEHRVTVRSIQEAEPGVLYPRLLAGKRRCPPEDVGGVPGYYDFLEAIADPRSQESREMLEWYGESYDPEDFDQEGTATAMAAMATR